MCTSDLLTTVPALTLLATPPAGETAGVLWSGSSSPASSTSSPAFRASAAGSAAMLVMKEDQCRVLVMFDLCRHPPGVHQGGGGGQHLDKEAGAGQGAADQAVKLSQQTRYEVTPAPWKD